MYVFFNIIYFQSYKSPVILNAEKCVGSSVFYLFAGIGGMHAASPIIAPMTFLPQPPAATKFSPSALPFVDHNLEMGCSFNVPVKNVFFRLQSPL
jgi:hypothetical protein